MSENERIAVAYSAIEKIWGDTMGWEQIETLARAVVRALDEAGGQPTSVRIGEVLLDQAMCANPFEG